MDEIEGYIADLDQAYIDAAASPFFQSLMGVEDYETIEFAEGGVAFQATALSKSSAKKIILLAIDRLVQGGADLSRWVCEPEDEGGFDLCRKLQSLASQSDLMRSLNEFLSNKFLNLLSGGITLASLLGLVLPDPISLISALLAAIGLTSDGFRAFCKCHENTANAN